jgi:sec-independent protein translocase protein TatA
MGLGGISVWQLLIILAIVVMLFGTKRLRTLGSDLGTAIKGFRSSIKEEEPAAPKPDSQLPHDAEEGGANSAQKTEAEQKS